MSVVIYRQAQFAGEALDHRAVRHSRNLRGLLDHARRTPPFNAVCHRDSDGGATLYVGYANGDWSRVSFASYRVAVSWVNSRRSWGFTHSVRCSDTQHQWSV